MSSMLLQRLQGFEIPGGLYANFLYRNGNWKVGHGFGDDRY